MKKPISILVLFLMCVMIYSQEQKEKTKIVRNENQIIKSVEFSEDDKAIEIPKSSNEFFSKFLPISGLDQFIKVAQKPSRNEYVHEFFDQFYNGIKVDRAGYSFHYKNGRMYLAHGNFIALQDFNTNPVINKQEAMSCFADFKSIPISAITNYRAELLIKEIEFAEEKDTLFIPRLVYKVYLLSDHENNTDIGYVDASSGIVLLSLPKVFNASSLGTFYTRYNGTQQSLTDYTSGAYRLLDLSRGSGIHTWNIQGSNEINNRIELTDNDNIWTTAEHGTSENDMALDVHWTLQKIYDHLISAPYNINSFDDFGFPIDAHIHWGQKDNSGYNWEENVLLFGDGYSSYRPVCSLDIVAHEYAHGICDFRIGWHDNALERCFTEGMADIWGSILENRIRPNSIWKIGEQVSLKYQCIRNIQNTNDAGAEMKIANTYLSAQYNNSNSNDNYIRSGVLSHWFYLLVNGESGRNDIGNSYTVWGVGMDIAEKLIVEAIFNNFLTTTTSYPDIRDQMVKAVKSVCPGENTLLLKQVENAWYAVGVGGSSPQIFISRTGGLGGDNYACKDDILTFTLNNLPTDISSIAWSYDGCLAYVSGQNTSTLKLKVGSSCGSPKNIYATLSCSQGANTIVSTTTQWIGAPSMSSISGPTTAKIYNGYSFYAYANYSNGTSYNWWTSPTSSYVYPYTPNMANIYFNSQGGYTVYAQAYNACGQNTPLGKFVMVTSTGLLSISPNPADEFLNVSIKNEQPIVIDSSDIVNHNSIMINSAVNEKSHSYSISISDNLGLIVYNTTKNSNNFSIHIGNLKDGNYILLVTDGVNKYDSHFIVNHK